MLKTILGAMLDGLAVGTEALDLTVLDTVAQKSRNLLRTPWSIDAKETPRSRTTLFLQAPGKDRVGLREEQTIVRAGHNSRIGRLINRKSVLGNKLGKDDYLTVLTGLMELLAREGLVSRVDIEADLQGWRLSPSAVRIIPGEATRAAHAVTKEIQDRIYRARRTLDDVRSLRESAKNEKPAPSGAAALDAIRAQLDAGRTRARVAIRTLEERYQGVMAAWLPEGITSAIKLDGHGLKVDAEFAGRGEVVSTPGADRYAVAGPVGADRAVLQEDLRPPRLQRLIALRRQRPFGR
ncbi:hypothetical protein [Sphingomonas elodea]|uniref:hypothetical protein n=1 Tax=Sphingomonas elodea TaxID=179878 RepID=UPI0002630733|nr:hypothetical protein [Sphingomonas elodea]